jgi:hypothetical protein
MYQKERKMNSKDILIRFLGALLGASLLIGSLVAWLLIIFFGAEYSFEGGFLRTLFFYLGLLILPVFIYTIGVLAIKEVMEYRWELHTQELIEMGLPRSDRLPLSSRVFHLLVALLWPISVSLVIVSIIGSSVVENFIVWCRDISQFITKRLLNLLYKEK